MAVLIRWGAMHHRLRRIIICQLKMWRALSKERNLKSVTLQRFPQPSVPLECQVMKLFTLLVMNVFHGNIIICSAPDAVYSDRGNFRSLKFRYRWWRHRVINKHASRCFTPNSVIYPKKKKKNWTSRNTNSLPLQSAVLLFGLKIRSKWRCVRFN